MRISSSTAAVVALCCALIPVSRAYAAKPEAPAHAVTLTRDQIYRLRNFFSRAARPAPLESDIRRILLADTPAGLRRECDSQIATTARGALDIEMLSRTRGHVWLAYRCDWGRGGINPSYTERLALLDLSAGTMSFVDLRQRGESANTLYHVEYGGTIALKNSTGRIFLIYASDGKRGPAGITITHEQDRVMILTVTPSGISRALAVTTMRRSFADTAKDGQRAAKSVYRTHLKFQRNRHGRAVAAVIHFSERSPGRPARTGVIRYKWDSSTGRFERAAIGGT